MRRRWFVAIAVFVLLVGGAIAGAWIWNERQTADVRGSATTEFTTTEEPGTTTRPQEEVRTEPWPMYGYDLARTRVAPDFGHRPPFRRLWAVSGRRLIEFPPVVAYGRLYFADISGRFLAVDVTTGEIVWKKEFGRFTAASPVVADGVVYQPVMNKRGTDRNRSPGFLIAMDAETGDELWRFRAGAVESSPLIVDGTIYFGTFDDKLYALNARSGRVRWAVQTGDDVKGGPAFARGTIYFGSYDGKVYAVDARTGKMRWESESRGGLTGAGNFYATPAVAYGRVFIGNTDGRVYAFGARSGNLLWAKGTGGFVYSSAAVFNRTVYVGSYDHRLYALDAATGDVRWSFEANGRVSGAATVLDGIVYFATLNGRTYGLDARSGKRVFTFPDGEYTPIVADEERVYLVGRKRVYGLEPRS
jgi:outer membrane protein assembly factor BamB